MADLAATRRAAAATITKARLDYYVVYEVQVVRMSLVGKSRRQSSSLTAAGQDLVMHGHAPNMLIIKWPRFTNHIYMRLLTDLAEEPYVRARSTTMMSPARRRPHLVVAFLLLASNRHPRLHLINAKPHRLLVESAEKKI